MRRAFTAVLAVSAVSLLLASCAAPTAAPAPTPTTPPAPTATPEPVRLVFWNYWDGKNGEVIQALADEYDQTHPEVEIQNVFIGWGELLPKLMTAAAGGETPDVAAGDIAWVRALIESGGLVALDDFIADSGVDLNDFYPELLTFGRYQDSIYSLPVSTNNLELFYNKDLFSAAGLDPEQPPTTWDELADMAMQCANPDEGILGMELYTGTGEGLTWQFQVYLWQAGAEFMTADYTAPAFNSEAGQRALQFWVDLIEEGASTIADWGQFGQGKACMVMDGSWLVGIWREQAPVDFGTAPMPLPEGGRRATNMGGEQIFIFSTTPERERLAWEFVNWLIDTETQITWDTQTGFTPVRDSVATSPEYQAWLDTEEPRLKPFVEMQRYARARPPIPKYAQISDAFSREIQKALFGALSVEEALASAEAAVNEVLGR